MARLRDTDDRHRTLFDTAVEQLYGALDEARGAATCRRRMAALGRAYEAWGHMTAEHIASTGRQQGGMGRERDEASDALLEAREIFESTCLRNRNT